MTLMQRRINVDITSWHFCNVATTSVQRDDVNATSHQRRCAPTLIRRCPGDVCPLGFIVKRLACRVKISAGDFLKYFFFFYFCPENSFWHFMQTVSDVDSLHEMSKPIFCEQYEKYHQFVVCWIKPESGVGQQNWKCSLHFAPTLVFVIIRK